jgi:uncharacterized membrane protein
MPASHTFFSAEQQERILNAVKVAEQNTSGEIRVHIEEHCPDTHVLDRASQIFSQLAMEKTMLRNGVLFYLAYKDHKFAIVGDIGINSVVPANFWDNIKVTMQIKFRSGNYTDGLCTGILMAGEQLRKHFPYQDDDINEIPDDISFG